MPAKPKLLVDVNYASPAIDDSAGLVLDYLRSPSPLARGSAMLKPQDSFALDFSSQRCLSESSATGIRPAQPYSGTVAPLFNMHSSSHTSDGLLEIFSPSSSMMHPIEMEATTAHPPSVAKFAVRTSECPHRALPVCLATRGHPSTSGEQPSTTGQRSPHHERKAVLTQVEPATTTYGNAPIVSPQGRRKHDAASSHTHIDVASVELDNSGSDLVWSLAAEDGIQNSTSGQFAPAEDHVLYFHEDH